MAILLTRKELVALVECGRELATQIDLGLLLRGILRRANQLMDSSDSSVILHNDRSNTLYFAAAMGKDAAHLVKEWGESSTRQIPLKGSKAGEVFKTGKSIVVNRLHGERNHFKLIDEDTRRTTESMICVPLVCAGERLGVMQICNRRKGRYEAADCVLLENFAVQAAIAIRNARLIEDLLTHMGMRSPHEASIHSLTMLEELNRPARAEKLSVLFADMRGFTQLCQILNSPEKTQYFLTEFNMLLADQVLENRGQVNKFLGDGLMALFRDGDHAHRAVHAAFQMLDRFRDLRASWDAKCNEDVGFLDLGVGITTDTVVLGSIGNRRGLRDYTAVGTAVNLACFLQHEARNGKHILVDRMTYLAVKDVVTVDGPNKIVLKKPDQALGHVYDVYHLLALMPQTIQVESIPSPDLKSAAPQTPLRNTVFVSHSHKDKRWLEKLHEHLKPYVRKGHLTIWDDTKIGGGANWRDEIDKALASAKVAVLLVSPNFLASDFIATSEIPALLRAAEQDGMNLLWIPLSASAYTATEIEKYQAAVNPRTPLDSMTPAERNRVLVKIGEQIRLALGSF